jgi:hypothetical protein
LGPRALVARGDRRWPHVFHITSAYGHDQRYPRHEQQQQDGFAECRVIQFSVQAEATPDAGDQYGKGQRILLERLDRKRLGDGERNRAHREGCEHHRLKDCALRVLGTPAQLAPHRHRNTTKPGQSADQAVCDAHCELCRGTGLYRFKTGPGETIETVDHQQNAHREANRFGIDCRHKSGTGGNTERAAEDEWCDRPPVYGVTNPPDAGTLRDKSAQHNEKRSGPER